MESSGIKKQYYVEGIDCANCAAKIEERVRGLNEIEEANLDFVFKKLTFQIKDGSEEKKVFNKVREIVKAVEPDVDLKEVESEQEDEGLKKKDIIRLSMGIVIFALAYILKEQKFGIVLFLISYVLIGGEVILKSIRNIRRGEIFDENFLMTVATVGAFAIKEFPEAVSVMLFYEIGEFFQDKAVERSRKSIKSLLNIKAEFANVKNGSELKKVNPEEVRIDDFIVVKPGEKVPLDGVITEGVSFFDTSAITGEPVPKSIKPGEEVFSGYINKEGLITVKVKRTFENSAVSKILNLVENASSRKADTEKFITKFAKYYTPIVVFSALFIAVLPPLFIKNASFSSWIYKALVFLVVSCPCALVISIPLSFFGGIGAASKKGILVKGGNYLEILNDVSTMVFDKTGTLTKGTFSVDKIQAYNGFDEKDVLKLAASVEAFSNHPIAVSIVEAYGQKNDEAEIKEYKEIAGHGIQAYVNGKLVFVGNEKLMLKENIDVKEEAFRNDIGTVIYVSCEGSFVGSILISDKLKEDTIKAIEALKRINIKPIMFTGDNKKAALKVSQKIGIDDVKYELLPQDKVYNMEKIFEGNMSGRVAFVGDGINDAPVLARADVGISMGSFGSDAAVEASDVVIMTDEPYKIYEAVLIAKSTRSIVWQNIVLALGVKAIVLLLTILGISNMWEAVFADVGVALLAVLNSLRILKK
ncbi:Cd2+/Zn2+-exporting ATPase [Clostridium acetobutylicum]|uniref:Cd(2+)-exporting ATPase n=1 Tax=Clostridium acetobutylicum (strain ATCC 824 / DSM 792 / JCM 1419 / IAM 19013 / LMG 5710 / NBRC 13948 / NRRL B-527 / VKM B-1787 / 2291 / W) TaxID=272562 RepID=Q97GX4_CLOAB|nr:MULTISPECIES: heavy metal translocating P-type ATPase [Clostridium]AAK80198.1 Cation transport P-type ATPase [Clostridium acetobutylicum ATCC 824]ADZ21292.1 Cation transport P-type ATPase [Clostridium acetobutylicum EA 2018]AEI33469.1 cation transport P-type ATPase [Clostridium acetobutylicum DSM 1731]AWV79377.1 cadmium-translocating P-type ATPase [Clostridium acetobutylicum]MBC2394652.1 cadmium-translocating P-type ATPase [Clostridium acetobutylicum]